MTRRTAILTAMLVAGLLLTGGVVGATFSGDDAAGAAPLRSDEGIDSRDCNLVHNIEACDQEELHGDPPPPLHGDPPPRADLDETLAASLESAGPIRSDEGIDRSRCNLVHNISACSDDELRAGMPLDEDEHRQQW